MSDAKKSDFKCETVALYPVRIALANRIGSRGESVFPDYWPDALKSADSAPEIPHWGYACRQLRPQGLVYVYYDKVLYEYSATNRGFSCDNAWRLQGDDICEVPCGNEYAPAIYVPKHTTGNIAYSENVWGQTRLKQILSVGKVRAQRMYNFNTKAPARRMLPFSLANWNVVEEMREIPNGLVCMGVELGLTPSSRYEQLCYHGLRNASLLRLGKMDLNNWNMHRRNLINEMKLGQDALSAHCLPMEQDKQLAEKFPHHISWHAVETVSPFVWLWQKKSNGKGSSYEFSTLGKELVALTCGYIVVLDDPVGICRELSALCDMAHEDESLYAESTHYLTTIAQYIQSLKQAGAADSMLKYLQLGRVDGFLKKICTTSEYMAAYLADVTAAREVWMHSNSTCKSRLWRCFEDLPPDAGVQLCAKERMLDGVLSNFAHTDIGLALADKMFTDMEDQQSLLWSTVCPATIGSVPFPETEATSKIVQHLWRFFLPADKASLSQRTKANRKWLQSLNDRGVLLMVEKQFSIEQMQQFAQWLEGPVISTAPEPSNSWATLVYPWVGAEGTPPPPHISPIAVPAQAESLSLTPQYNLYIPKSLEAHATFKDLKLTNVNPRWRTVVSLIAANGIWQVWQKKERGTLEVLEAVIATGAMGFGLAEWGMQHFELVARAEGVGLANKSLGALLGMLLALDLGLQAADALYHERYAKGLQLASQSVASGMVGYSALAKALDTAANPSYINIPVLRAMAKRALARLPYGHAVALRVFGRCAVLIFLAAEIYALYEEASDPLNVWGKHCVFSNLNMHISLEKLCATAPLYPRLSLPGSPAERLEHEHEELFKALYTPTVQMRPPTGRISNISGELVLDTRFPDLRTVLLRAELPGTKEEDCRLWLWWERYNAYAGKMQAEGVYVLGQPQVTPGKRTRTVEAVLRVPSSAQPAAQKSPSLHYTYAVQHPALGTINFKSCAFTGRVEV